MIALPVSAPHVPCEIAVSPPLQVASTTVEVGDYAIYSCVQGYLLVGESTRYCSRNERLDGIEPNCSLIYCPDLTTTSPLSVSVSNLTYAFNGLATYSCAAGYFMSGSNTRSCQADGTWNGSAPTCEIATCPTLSATDPLNVSVTDVYIGDIATYSCATGFEINGTYTRTCQNDGTWGDAEPTCTPITCPTISAPIHGQVNFLNGLRVGGDAVFGCSPGYILSNNKTATCTVAGSWDITPPSCLYNGMN